MEFLIGLVVIIFGVTFLGGLTEGIVKVWEFIERLENAE